MTEVPVPVLETADGPLPFAAHAQCPRCYSLGWGPEASTGVNYWCDRCQAWFARCAACGKTYAAPQSPYCKDGHEAAGTYHPFTHYFDFALGEEVTSLAERKRYMRNLHLDYRDKMSAGDVSARRDRVHEQRKEQSRG